MPQPTYTESDPDPYTGISPAPLRRDQVYGELRKRLMLGEFSVQRRLAEESMATLLGVSRTPVREALIRLEADGLVVRTSHGYFAALPDLHQLRDLYELRTTLELHGLTRAVGSPTVRHDLSLLEPLRDQWRAMQTDQPDPDPTFVSVDEDFHLTLSRSSGNAALADSLMAVNARIRPVRMYDFLTEDRIELTITQHLGLLEHLLNDRLPEAVQALHEHVGESMEVVERRAAHAITQMALNRGRQS